MRALGPTPGTSAPSLLRGSQHLDRWLFPVGPARRAGLFPKRLSDSSEAGSESQPHLSRQMVRRTFRMPRPYGVTTARHSSRTGPSRPAGTSGESAE